MAYAWAYDSSSRRVSNRRALVAGMASGGHVTRTLLTPTRHLDLLLISYGTNANLDMGTADVGSGRSMVKVFNVSAIATGAPANYTADGVVLGWGLRNSVGLAAHPANGGIWSVENSLDQLSRLGVDLHKGAAPSPIQSNNP